MLIGSQQWAVPAITSMFQYKIHSNRKIRCASLSRMKPSIVQLAFPISFAMVAIGRPVRELARNSSASRAYLSLLLNHVAALSSEISHWIRIMTPWRISSGKLCSQVNGYMGRCATPHALGEHQWDQQAEFRPDKQKVSRDIHSQPSDRERFRKISKPPAGSSIPRHLVQSFRPVRNAKSI
jgi:hypothetical protein